MILSWALIGIVVGVLLGLTGAGGAVIAIPLFVHLAGASLREATVYSLVTVMSGAALNWLFQRRATVYATAIPLFAFATLGAYAFQPIKERASEALIFGVFVAVAAFSLLATWKKTKGPASTGSDPGWRSVGSWTRAGISGFALGGLVTLTGLGGGVILVPLLTGLFGLAPGVAAATSLLTVLLTSGVSLAMQWPRVATAVTPILFAVVAVGSLVSALIIRTLVRRLSTERLDFLRRWIVSAVLVISVVSLWGKVG